MWGERDLAYARRATLIRAVCAFALCGGASSTHAQPTSRVGIGLNWVRLEGAEGCVSSVDLMNRIEEHAGRILFVRTGEAALTLDGYVRPGNSAQGAFTGAAGGASWAVVFEVSDAKGNVLGRRDLGMLTGDCSVVTQAAELIFDLTLDPDGVLGVGIPLEPRTQRLLDELLRGEPFDPDPRTLPSGARNQKPRASAVNNRKPKREAPRPTSEAADTEPVTLDATGVMTLGALPRIAPGVGVHVTIPTRIDWLIELGVLALAEQTVAAASGDIGQVTFGLQAGSLAVCPPRLLTLLFLCAGAEYARQSISASGFSTVRDAPSRALLSLVAEGTLRFELLSWLYLRASTAVLVPLVRHEYVYDSRRGERILFSIPPVSGRAELGLGVTL